MLKIYLDNCCYCRPFDDLTQEKINLEANAIEEILKLHITKKLEIYSSMAIDFELSQINYGNKRRQVEDLYDAMDLAQIDYTQEIRQRAIKLKEYNKRYGCFTYCFCRKCRSRLFYYNRQTTNKCI